MVVKLFGYLILISIDSFYYFFLHFLSNWF